MNRHRDDGTCLEDFANRFQVACPDCGACALVESIPNESHPIMRIGKFCCPKCGASRTTKECKGSKRGPVDWHFGYPLWLQAECAGHTLWAYNLEHLGFLEAYIAAEQREGIRAELAQELGVRNKTLASSLPEWMILARNREKLLKAIGKIRNL